MGGELERERDDKKRRRGEGAFSSSPTPRTARGMMREGLGELSRAREGVGGGLGCVWQEGENE